MTNSQNVIPPPGRKAQRAPAPLTQQQEQLPHLLHHKRLPAADLAPLSPSSEKQSKQQKQQKQQRQQREQHAKAPGRSTNATGVGRAEGRHPPAIEGLADDWGDAEWDAYYDKVAGRIKISCDIVNGSGDLFNEEMEKWRVSESTWSHDVYGVEQIERPAAVDVYTKMKVVVPNVRVYMQRVEQDKFTVVKHMWLSGTPLQAVLPMFPVNEFMRVRMCSKAVQDHLGRILHSEHRVSFDGELGVSPSMLEWLLESARALMAKESGSRTLQEAIEVAQTDDKRAIAGQLQGHVWAASASPHSNFLLQACIVNLPSSEVHFIAEELQGRAVEAAKHAIRSRILERLLEHLPADDLNALIMELIPFGPLLSRHNYGNFVMQRIFEHGNDSQRIALVTVLRHDAVQLAKHRHANNVVRFALVNGSLLHRRILADALTCDPETARSIERVAAGSFVMREVKALKRNGGLGHSIMEVSL